jgi:arylsulfatase
MYSAHAQDQQLPNIVLILADDLGYGDIEGYGGKASTPNLRHLQKEGMKFTSFYSQPQCSPSRAALMTGCYPQRVGIPWVVGPEGPAWTRDKHLIGLNAGETTIAELLKAKGYATACVGKWHLGHHKQHLPVHHGFDEYFGIPYSNDMWPPNGEYPPLPLVDGEKTIETDPDQTQLVKRYTDRAVSFIRKHKSSPFFLYLAHNMPHVPLFVSQEFMGKSGKGLYADVIEEMDWSAGELIKALTENGLDNNTIFIFTSDNGPWLLYGNHAGSAGTLREGKNTTFEGGVRVPFIARWPDKIKSNTVCDIPAALFDLLPTFADITKSKLPGHPIDGKSLLPLFTGSTKAVRDVHYYYQINELQAVRKGKWKLHFPHTYDHITVVGHDGARGTIETANLELALFDLEVDVAEAHNVAAQHPEIVRELSALGEKFGARLKAESRKPSVAQ